MSYYCLPLPPPLAWEVVACSSSSPRKLHIFKKGVHLTLRVRHHVLFPDEMWNVSLELYFHS